MSKVKNIFKGDTVIWVIFFLFCVISIIEVYSATSTMSYKTGKYWAPLLSHCSFIVMGTVLIIIIQTIPYRYFRALLILLIPISIFLLIWALNSASVNEASRWITIFGKQWQPSEIAKGTLIITTANLLSISRKNGKASKDAFWSILFFTAIIGVLIGIENLSTAIILLFVVILMMFIGSVPWKHLIWLCSGLAILGIIAYATLRFTPMDTLDRVGKSVKMNRLSTWGGRLQKESHSDSISASQYNMADNLQRAHANIAIATSHVIGKMPGNSVARDFLPQAFSDFIYAIIIEELGLAGGLFVASLYIVLLFKVGQIANRCKHHFPAYLIMGLTLLITSQAILHMMVSVGLFNIITGQPLPFVSRGGTSILVNCIYIGMILSVSRYANNTKAMDENLITEEHQEEGNDEENRR